ncbi:UbiE/COQ5 methyltransferase [Cordyceps fumosorosea ARSEF 2679]|uniref:UbiE/COQ5 methyltransferase n=1 Tax=Cordyceps fumosorosea (strain ARSEF 2679) TaxID=1081104 RepID=A0A167R7H3_CORFA|nr:UbiE/COQ5 methyltransferase [Cordyceps fumosorosea ARSEF 2679]OAA58343.1 UbiE/COQ5 methyltransferase [Cordyceps fumosorosea ARSEF 2679]
MSAEPTEKLSTSLRGVFANADKHEDTWVRTSKTVIAKLAAPLLPRMGLTADRTAPVTLLDNAAGAGVMAQEVNKTLPRMTLQAGSILATDLSAALVTIMQDRIKTEGWINTEARVADAQDIKLPDNTYTHVSILLGLHIIPDPDAAVKEAIRVLKPGGVFGATTFPTHKENKFWFADVQTAFAAMPFDAPFPETMPMQMHDSGRWYEPSWVATHLAGLGLRDVNVAVQSDSYYIESADQFIEMFGMMLGYVTKMFWSEEQVAARPPEEVRELVRGHLVDKYEGGGWEVKWDVLYMTGRADK